uniref:SRCR domain-containing protein n=1 Tax=Gallus gallus TaxID=9031 RepID=A0A8V1A580_CHICK
MQHGWPQSPARAPRSWPSPAQVSALRKLRLVGGRGRCAGRVEVYSEGTWGTICQDSWTQQDATVVCRQLGCGWALEAPGSERFGPGTGTLWLGAGGCAGTEDALWHCPAPVQRGCRRGGGAGAVRDSSEATSPAPGSSLQDRDTSANGFVHAHCPLTAAIRSPWGLTLPITSLTSCGASLLCRWNDSCMWLVLTPGPHVRENTPSYLCCREGTGLHVPRCRRTKAAAGPHSDVVASRVQRESPEELRLVDGGGRCAGRVEVKHEGEWGSVCSYDFDWDIRVAGMVCRQLGCGTVAHASPYAPFGQGKGRIWLHPFLCQGTETTLQNCPHFECQDPWAGLRLIPDAEALELRLADGRGPCDGRVEVKLRGRWGTVADDAWDMDDAEVVCQQLGCGSAASTKFTWRISQVSSPVMLVRVNCNGTEKAIWDCNIQGWGPYSTPLDYSTSVVCQGESWAHAAKRKAHCPHSPSPAAHLSWQDSPGWPEGTASAQGGWRCGRARPGSASAMATWTSWPPRWSAESWAVVLHWPYLGLSCLGYEQGYSGMVPSSAMAPSPPCPLAQSGLPTSRTAPNPLPSSAPVSAGSAGLHQPQTMWWPGEFPTPPTPAPLSAAAYSGFRLADGVSVCDGRVEVEARGVWGTLCATAWDLPDAHVLCHHLGCGTAVSLPPPGHFGMGTGMLRSDAFRCSGSERHPGQCPVEVLGQPTCPPGHTAAVNCSGGCGGRGDPQQVGSTAQAHGTARLLQVSPSPCGCTVGRAIVTGGWRWPCAPESGPVCLWGCGTTALPPWCAGSWAAVCLRKSMLCQPMARAP